MGRVLVFAGVTLVVMGLLWNRVPGNIELHGKNWTFYFPLGLCLLISVIGSLLMWLLGRR